MKDPERRAMWRRIKPAKAPLQRIPLGHFKQHREEPPKEVAEDIGQIRQLLQHLGLQDIEFTFNRDPEQPYLTIELRNVRTEKTTKRQEAALKDRYAAAVAAVYSGELGHGVVGASFNGPDLVLLVPDPELQHHLPGVFSDDQPKVNP